MSPKNRTVRRMSVFVFSERFGNKHEPGCLSIAPLVSPSRTSEKGQIVEGYECSLKGGSLRIGLVKCCALCCILRWSHK